MSLLEAQWWKYLTERAGDAQADKCAQFAVGIAHVHEYALVLNLAILPAVAVFHEWREEKLVAGMRAYP